MNWCEYFCNYVIVVVKFIPVFWREYKYLGLFLFHNFMTFWPPPPPSLLRTSLRAFPYRRIDIYCLHFCGLFGGGLLLHVSKTEANFATAHPILSPELPNGDFTNDPDLHKLKDSVTTIQYSNQLKFYWGLHPQVFVCQARIWVHHGLFASPLFIWLFTNGPLRPSLSAFWIFGVGPIFSLPSPFRIVYHWKECSGF